MSTHKYIDRICCIGLILVLLLTAFFANASKFGVQAAASVMGYEAKLFRTDVVHTIDIVMDDWDGFIENCENEEYELCSLVIDGEAVRNTGIRAKGNTSLSSVSAYGNDRYSFKIEFDHYDSAKSYYGLDKLSLNNIIQDNTYMKDYLTYQMMGDMGVNAPLCSYVYLTVNGEDWGLYLAVEGVEESFLERNYGSDYGELYKPDSMSMGGGRGNGGKFDIEELEQKKEGVESSEGMEPPESMEPPEGMETPEGMEPPEGMELPEGMEPKEGMTMPGQEASGEDPAAGPGVHTAPGEQEGGGMRGGSSDVSLIYSDEEYDSYSNIFDNAKTDSSNADKDRLIASLKKLNEKEDLEETVNIEEVIRYFVVHNFVCNFDSYTGSMIHNYYLYEEGGQLSMIPWDYNLAFGGFQSASDATGLVNYPIDTPVSGGTVDTRPMLAWIFDGGEYTELYHQYFREFIGEYFDSGYFTELMDSTQELIAPYVEKDPTKFCTYEEFKTGIAALRKFCELRAESVSGQLDGTIPATTDGQSQDASALIDASDLTISDMGSMGNMGPQKDTHTK